MAAPPLRRRRSWRAIGAALEAFQAAFPVSERLRADPVHLAHEHREAVDQEVVALVGSCLAFGRAASLIAKARAALAPLGPRPADAVLGLEPGDVPAHLRTWTHRWVRGADLAFLLAGVGDALREHGSLRAAFAAGLDDDRRERHLLAPLARFARRLRPADARPWFGSREPSPGARHLLPIPDGHGAAKRLNLFLRWMARPADGVDLGLWPEVGTERLTIPLDTHVARIGAYAGLTSRKTPGWLMAREITENLARFDPADPTRFDFALSHLGIMGGCPRRRDPRRCAACDLLAICRL